MIYRLIPKQIFVQTFKQITDLRGFGYHCTKGRKSYELWLVGRTIPTKYTTVSQRFRTLLTTSDRRVFLSILFNMESSFLFMD